MKGKINAGIYTGLMIFENDAELNEDEGGQEVTRPIAFELSELTIVQGSPIKWDTAGDKTLVRLKRVRDQAYTLCECPKELAKAWIKYKQENSGVNLKAN